MIDPRTPDAFTTLPKFLIADDGERDFVVHCHYPRFIMEFIGHEGIPTWIDQPIYDPAHGEPASQGARLMREAGEFFREQLEDL
jgi:hypothetical protein